MSDAGSAKYEGNGAKPYPPVIVGESIPASETKQESSNPKVTHQEALLEVPLQNTFGRASSTFSDISTYSAGQESDGRSGRLLMPSSGFRHSSMSPGPPATWKGKLAQSWVRNKGLALVISAQLFGVVMNVTTRLLETEGEGMHPLQILFARMLGTVILSSLYQWITKVEHAPFGPREVWGLLVARGVGGFWGAFGLYYSLIYLPLSDATVITFLAPIVACWACSILLHEPFTRQEQLAGIVSFIGVILIARPSSLIPHDSGSTTSGTSGSGTPDGLPSNSNGTHPLEGHNPHQPTPHQRLTAVGIALVGVLGAACAYTTIRWIGKRAHPLISVNYYAAWTTIVSLVGLLTIPGVDFRLPANARQWFYLFFLGVTGFVMQFMLTAGLSYERSSRATNMVYTQMLFALAFDKLVFNTSPAGLSIAGSMLILGSALYVAVLNNKAKDIKKIATAGTSAGVGSGLAAGEGREEEEMVGLMSHEGRELADDEEYDVQEVQLRAIRV